ncbi:hypothetical protein [Staphylococcus epidermidis]|uniref:hypothetical protein n=1 Tax=Staphylococcus epidermidis TaxID=1282 RepID=UPI00280B483F|nr:hypothetical protein [Staphylococcus epidermidis]
MSKSFISFVIANLVFVTMSILLALIGLYFTTAIGTGCTTIYHNFSIYMTNYFFQESKKDR